MSDIIQKLKLNTQQSAFNRRDYKVSFELADFYRSLRFYSESVNAEVADKDLVKAMTQSFSVITINGLLIVKLNS